MPALEVEMESTIERLLYKPAEAAAAIGVSRSKLYELVARGELPSVRVGCSVRVPVEELKVWIRKQAGVAA